MHNKTEYTSQSSPYFDLCRLAMTILDELDNEKVKNKDLYEILSHMATDINGNSFLDTPDTFDLYIDICKKARNSLPNDIISHPILILIEFQRKNSQENHFIHFKWRLIIYINTDIFVISGLSLV